MPSDNVHCTTCDVTFNQPIKSCPYCKQDLSPNQPAMQTLTDGPHSAAAKRGANSATEKALVIGGYVCGIAALFILPQVLALAAIALGILNLAKRRIGIGTSQIVIAIVCGIAGSIIGAAVGFYNAIGISPAESNASIESAPPLHVLAQDVYADYEGNEVGADLKYKGKALWIEGRIQSVGKDLAGTPYVQLVGTDNSMFGIHCRFSVGSEAELAVLETGQAFIVVGRGAGKLGNIIVLNSLVPRDDPEFKARMRKLIPAAAFQEGLRKRPEFEDATVTDSGSRVLIYSAAFRPSAERRKWAKILDNDDLFCSAGFTDAYIGSDARTGQMFSLHCK